LFKKTHSKNLARHAELVSASSQEIAEQVRNDGSACNNECGKKLARADL
jgi:hypothetical protein